MTSARDKRMSYSLDRPWYIRTTLDTCKAVHMARTIIRDSSSMAEAESIARYNLATSKGKEFWAEVVRLIHEAQEEVCV